MPGTQKPTPGNDGDIPRQKLPSANEYDNRQTVREKMRATNKIRDMAPAIVGDERRKDGRDPDGPQSRLRRIQLYIQTGWAGGQALDEYLFRKGKVKEGKS